MRLTFKSFNFYHYHFHFWTSCELALETNRLSVLKHVSTVALLCMELSVVFWFAFSFSPSIKLCNGRRPLRTRLVTAGSAKETGRFLRQGEVKNQKGENVKFRVVTHAGKCCSMRDRDSLQSKKEWTRSRYLRSIDFGVHRHNSAFIPGLTAHSK